MTNPDVPLRIEFSIELPGSADLVWEAIATAGGLNSWFLPTDIEEREGGALAFHMGETSSEGTVTGWDPPRRLEYVEPDWAEMTGHPDSPVTPMVSEFLVEAQSGGTCVLRVVTSAFGTGADWEREFWDEMERSYMPFFDNLRLYLTDFPGQTATMMEATSTRAGTVESVIAAMRRELGAERAGSSIDRRGLRGHVHRDDPLGFLVRTDDPVPGFVSFSSFENDGSTTAVVSGWFFSDDAPVYVEREQPNWTTWLESLDLELASTGKKSS